MSKLNQNISQESSGLINSILFMLRAVLTAYIFSIILMLPAALLATAKSFSDTGIYITANIITALGSAFAGFSAGRHFDSKGIFFGAGCGIIYSLILWLAGGIFSKALIFDAAFITAFIIGLLCGGVGGIAGINTKSTRRR